MKAKPGKSRGGVATLATRQGAVAPLRFAGNNYLALATAPVLKAAAAEALDRYGVSVSASRLSTGTEEIHLTLEASLARFMGREASLTFASGYLGNLILLQALSPAYDDVFMDAAAHPSLRDAVPRCKTLYEYATCDLSELEQLLRRHDRGRSLIATDGLFAMTGALAPLNTIGALAKTFGARLLVDDAHAVGLLGANGRGTPEHFGLDGAPDVYQTGTFSKAFGGYGGFIAGSHELMTAIRQRAGAFGGSTALPPPLAAADLAAIGWLNAHPACRQTLLSLADRARSELRRLGFETGGDGTPIAPLYFDTREEGAQLSEFLRQQQIEVPYFDYPVKTGRYLLRMTFALNHTEQQLTYLFDIMKQWQERQ